MKTWIYRTTLIFCILAVVGFILYNSTRTGEQSSSISQGVTDKVIEVVVPDFENFDEPKKEEISFNFHKAIRDYAHAIEFMALAFFVALLLSTFKFQYGRYSIPLVVTVFACFIFAMADEILQGQFTGRGTSVEDVGMDMLGVAVGCIVAVIIDFIGVLIFGRKKRKF